MSRRIFVLTGSGVSAESGLGTFRDKDGLWTKYDLAEVASRDGYERDPRKVLDFYNARRANLRAASPNAAHEALARLDRGLDASGGSLFLCTQNVDDLHERAGSRAVVHMHGELSKARCDACGAVTPFDVDLDLLTGCTTCGRVGEMRPHVVWFGEMPLEMDRIAAALAGSDLFVAIGTSGAVYPAAGFVAEARALAIPRVEINLEPSDNAAIFSQRYYGPATETVPRWVDSVLAGEI